MSSDNYKIRELNELNERLHENAQGSEIIIRELKIEIKRIKEKLKDSELRIEWITDKYGCRQPINTNPKRVFALKEENEQLKYDMAKKEWYCKIKDTGLYDECKDCPGGSK